MSMAQHNYKREALTNKDSITLPILTPISLHLHPPCARSLDIHLCNISTARNIGYKHEVEVVEAIHCETNPALFNTRDTGERVREKDSEGASERKVAYKKLKTPKYPQLLNK